MATKKKMLQAAAGNAGGAGLNVEDVFSTYLYTGTASNQTITNGIDLSGEGGLVWIKGRTNAQSHGFFDTERGVNKALASDANWAEFSYQGVNAFNSNGFRVGYQNEYNQNTLDYASWTFRKAPKFFDVVTYTGNGSNQIINHNLGSDVGAIIIKRTDSTSDWYFSHRYDFGGKMLKLNSSGAAYVSGITVTDTTFRVFGSAGSTLNNVSGATYIAYLFAHNDGDGEFGPDGDADIIKCGSYTGNGSSNGPEIDLGFEPQWVMLKNTEGTGDWLMFDNMRGIDDSTSTKFLEANTSSAENTTQGIKLTSTGFQVTGNNIDENSSGVTYIYIAIRRGTKVPESATEVFTPAVQYDETDDIFESGFVTDALLWRSLSTSEFKIGARLTQGKAMRFDTSLGELSYTPTFDYMNGANAPVNDSFRGWMWKRAPEFCDISCYTGTGSVHNVSHNLGAVPEMMWVKRRDNTDMWKMYHSNLGNTKYIRMDGSFDGTSTPVTNSTTWNNTTPSDTTFTVGTASDVNGNGNTYIAYLFSSLDGISKVGSASHSGTTNVDCGFTSGARFVLLKRTDASGDWYVWDSERGIVSGNDPYLLLNSTAAQVTNTDYIDPLASGFTITSNFTAGDYIFYAIA